MEDPELENPRAAAFELSPSGPIFGTRVLEPAGEVAVRERAALAARAIDPERLRPPRGIRLRGARRALRVRVEAERYTTGDTVHVTEARLTMVSVNAAGRPIPFNSRPTVGTVATSGADQ